MQERADPDRGPLVPRGKVVEEGENAVVEHVVAAEPRVELDAEQAAAGELAARVLTCLGRGGIRARIERAYRQESAVGLSAQRQHVLGGDRAGQAGQDRTIDAGGVELGEQPPEARVVAGVEPPGIAGHVRVGVDNHGMWRYGRAAVGLLRLRKYAAVRRMPSSRSISASKPSTSRALSTRGIRSSMSAEGPGRTGSPRGLEHAYDRVREPVDRGDRSVVADVERLADSGGCDHRAQNAPHHVVDVAPRPDLRAVAMDDQVLAGDRPQDESRNAPSPTWPGP